MQVSLSRSRVADPQRLEAFGAARALHGDGGWVTYAELADRVRWAQRQLGDQRSLVAVPEGRSVDHVVWMLAALGGGHVLLPYDGARAAEVLSRYPASARLVPGPDGLDLHRQHPSLDLHPDLSLLLSTSGSTGSPKLVRLSAEGIDANAAAIAEYMALEPDDCAVTSLPLAYSYGFSVLTSHLAVGAAVVLSDLSVVDACFWDLARRTGVTTLAGVPHTFDMLERTGFDGRSTLPTLRRMTQAGGRMPVDRVRRFARMAQAQTWDLHVMYGQTEATARIAHLPPELALAHPDCVGVPIPGGSLRIDDGELVYRGPNVMLGYATCVADLARGRTIEELRTGDRAEITDAGLLRILGRTVNEAKLFGLRIDLDHLEQHLPGAVVVAADDELVVLDPAGCRVEEVRRLTGLPACAVRGVRTRIPMLPNGKVDRAQARAVAQRPPEKPAVADGDLTTRVRAALSATLKRDIALHDSFVSAGGDSLAYVAASVRLEQVLGRLPRDWHTKTVAELVGAGPSRSRWGAVVEMAVALRAAAVLLIVASHTVLVDVRGGAHLLLGIAGYNFARFVLPVEPGRPRLLQAARGIAAFAVPALLWLAVVVAVTPEYGMSVFGVTFSAPPGDDPAWRYWFVEVLLIVLLLAAAVTAPRAVARLERRAPAVFALGLLVMAVVAREVFFDATGPRPLFTVAASAWVFFLGWLLAVGSHRRWNLVASALVVVLVVPFFAGGTRDIVVAGGLLLLLWVPQLRVPRVVATVLTAVAAASLTIYLTHWQVYPPFAQWPVVAAAVAVGAGIVLHEGAKRVGLVR